MKRFILITFAFMAWGFYELSGGDEFKPMRASVEASTPVVQAELPAAPVDDVAQASAQTETEGFVDTDPPLVAETVTATSEAVVPETVVIATAQEAVPENVDVPQSDGTVISSQDTPAIIPSLIVADSAAQTQPAAVDSFSGDVRRVSGSRVNVRGGPGTDFGVVTRLLRGDEVEVILDNGDGWVKMRPIDGGPEGWMADFLLTSG